MVRDAVNATLPGADANVPNSVLRVLSDTEGGLCHLNLQYLDWLALQLMVDTAETEWLDRHGQIWLVNADGSTGRKLATLSVGLASFTGLVQGAVIPAYTKLSSPVTMPAGTDLANPTVTFETLQDITVSPLASITGSIRALDPGALGNIPAGTALSLSPAPPGVSGTASIVLVSGGTDEETDPQLRMRILQRIRNPPMGGSEADYVRWALAVPGVTRAWAKSEIGPGTITIRFMMDDVRADNGGFPLASDLAVVDDYIETVRPVTVKDTFVLAPIPFNVDMHITDLDPDTNSMVNAIEDSLLDVFLLRAVPGQTFYRSWVDQGISAAGANAYTLTLADQVMPDNAHLPVLGTITYD